MELQTYSLEVFHRKPSDPPGYYDKNRITEKAFSFQQAANKARARFDSTELGNERAASYVRLIAR